MASENGLTRSKRKRVATMPAQAWKMWLALAVAIASVVWYVPLPPANGAVARALDGVRTGAVVTLRGWLIDVDAADGWRWRTSRTREDTGAGACEIIWVESVAVEEHSRG